MNYFLAAAALKTASLTPFTKRAYRKLAKVRAARKQIIMHRVEWILSFIPETPFKVLELGTGWISAYSILPSMVRPNCEMHCFDIEDIRYSLEGFKRAVDECESYAVSSAKLERHSRKAALAKDAQSIDDAYAALGLKYQVRSNGLPDYRSEMFDLVYSIDVLEHIHDGVFQAAANRWMDVLKPGGHFIAQVGLNDHTSLWCAGSNDKRYLSNSLMMWRCLLGNEVQYVNRMTASEIVSALERAGVETVEQTRVRMQTPVALHPDYSWQDPDDAQTIRLIYVGKKSPAQGALVGRD